VDSPGKEDFLDKGAWKAPAAECSLCRWLEADREAPEVAEQEDNREEAGKGVRLSGKDSKAAAVRMRRASDRAEMRKASR
jgi:hypothetical protein